MERYPYQFSGGQQQRIAIAIALSCRPSLLVLDEPTTGLDVTTQARIIEFLKQQIADTSISVLFVSHDLSLLATVANRLAIMYAGEIVEQGPSQRVITHPAHPYTQALIAAVPDLRRPHRMTGIPGRPPLSVHLESCAFATRCPHVVDACYKRIPLEAIGRDHEVRCIRAREFAFSITELAPMPPERPGGPDLLLSVRNLVCAYPGTTTPAVKEVSLDINVRETVGIVGESGSGSRPLLRSIVGLHRPVSGEIAFRSFKLQAAAGDRPREIRQAIQLIFQNPDSSLNPRQSVLDLVKRSMVLFRPDIPARRREADVAELPWRR